MRALIGSHQDVSLPVSCDKEGRNERACNSEFKDSPGHATMWLSSKKKDIQELTAVLYLPFSEPFVRLCIHLTEGELPATCSTDS